MARAHGCDLRAVLAGAIICCATAEGIAVAQDAAEAREELGNSYLLTRRTTDQGSVIETLLYDGQAIVTDIAVPALDTGMTVGTTGAVAPAAGGASASSLTLPRSRGREGWGPGEGKDGGPSFGGTWLTGEIVGDYLVLHRIRASGPVAHDIFYQGRKVGSVTEIGPVGRDSRSAGRNSFAFESTNDRFVVYLTQPDGTRIHATTEHGRFLGQTVERPAAFAASPRSGAGIAAPLQPRPGALGPSAGRSGEPQRLAPAQEAKGSIMVEEPAPPAVRPVPDTMPLAPPFPLPRTRPAIDATAVRPASPSPAANPTRNAPAATTIAPTARPQPAATSVNAPPPAAAAARPAAPASAVTAPAGKPKPAMAAVSAHPPAATTAKPVAPASATAAPAAKPRPVGAGENTRPPSRAAAKPVTPAARPSRSSPSDSKSGT